MSKLNGTIRDPALSIDRAYAVSTDVADDIVAAGVTTNASTLRDFTVIKLSGTDGRRRWCRRVDGKKAEIFTNDQALAVATDGAAFGELIKVAQDALKAKAAAKA